MNYKTANSLRVTAIVFMGLTAAMNLLGGAGTVCAAFLTKKYPPMWVFMDYQWLYQPIMIITIIMGFAGVWATVKLTRGGTTVYRDTMIILVLGTLLAGIQVYASLMIRGKAVPANMKLYANAVTLILFLLLKLPRVRERVDFSRPAKKAEQAAAGGIAAFAAGIMTLSTFFWVGPSHSYMGNNWVEEYQFPILVLGSLLAAGGLTAILWALNQMLLSSTSGELAHKSKS